MAKPDLSQQDAATKVQSVARGRAARRRSLRISDGIVSESEKRSQEASALKIQAIHRGRAGRQRAEMTRTKEQCAVEIQRIERGRYDRRLVAALMNDGRPLTSADLRKGLSCLGRNPFNLKHTFLKLTCSDQMIDDVTAITSFPLLETVDLSSNKLKDVTPLSHLPYLTDLNVSGNQLAEVLDFQASKCTSENRWETGDGNYGSLLRFADFSDNRIAVIRDLKPHGSSLVTLRLSGNLIRRIEGLEHLGSLQHLDLSKNAIESISGLDRLPLLTLNLEHNKLSKIEGLHSLAKLHSLKLGYNNISSLDGLQLCAQLQYLEVPRNDIRKIREVEHLSALSQLSSLVLSNNPVAELELDDLNFYRLRVLVRLQCLTSLDGRLVTPEEKMKALNLHGGDMSDIPHREEVFKKYFPDRELVNQLPPFVEPEAV